MEFDTFGEMNKRIIPMLMLHSGQLYKSVQFSTNIYIGDPLIAVKIFNEKLAEELSIVDIDPCKYGSEIQFELLEQIAGECFMPLSYGGGIKTVEDVRKILYSGFEKVVLNSIVFKNQEVVRQMVDEFGSSTIVVSIDYKTINGMKQVFVDGGKTNTNIELMDYLQTVKSLQVGEIILKAIDLDGTMSGMDLETIQKVSSAIQVPVIANGGVGHLNDISAGFSAGASAVGVSSLFVFKGPLKAVLINYPDPQVTKQVRNRSHVIV